MLRILGQLMTFAAIVLGATVFAMLTGRHPVAAFAGGGLLGAFLWGSALTVRWNGPVPARERFGVLVLMIGGTIFLFSVLVGFYDAGGRFLARIEEDPAFLPGFGGLAAGYFACQWFAMLLGSGLARPFVRGRPGPVADEAREDGLVATYRADPFRERAPEPELPPEQRLEPTYLARERAAAEAVARQEATERGPRLLPLLPRFLLVYFLGVAAILALEHLTGWDANVGTLLVPVWAAAMHVGGHHAKRGGKCIPGWRAFGFGLVATLATSVPGMLLLWATGDLARIGDVPPEVAAITAVALVGMIVLVAALTRLFMGIGLKAERKRMDKLAAQPA